MAQKKNDNTEYVALKKALASGSLDRCYIFHGEEKYLMENFLTQIYRRLVDKDFAQFNYKRFNGQGLSIDELASACDMLPVFSQHTLIVVYDFDMFKASDDAKQKLMALLTDLPEYVCLIFVYDIAEYKPDGRQKLSAVLKTCARIVAFSIQDQSEIVKWIKKHFSANGKNIDTPTAEHLAHVTGGLMTSMNVEIDKISASTGADIITVSHIDAVVTPVMSAIVFELTDAIANKDFDTAAASMNELISMREPPHKLIFMISLVLRQLLAARTCLDHGLSEKKLMAIAQIRYDFQARKLISSARKLTLEECRNSVILCCEAAYRMNIGSDPEQHLIDLILALSNQKRSNQR